MEMENIKILGHVGSWYVIDQMLFNGQTIYLLEHETYGEDAAALIVAEDLKIILDDVWNGFDDFLEYIGA